MKRVIMCLVMALCVALFGLEVNGSEQVKLTVQSVGSSDQLPATLIKPDGAGPFPAIVIMHDCSGLGPRSSGAPMRWAQELVPQGYVVLVPDSFSPRGFSDGVCSVPAGQANAVNGVVRARDA